MSSENIPHAAAQIAAREIDAIGAGFHAQAMAHRVAAALAAAGWLHDPTEVAALRAVADAARVYCAEDVQLGQARAQDAWDELNAALDALPPTDQP